MQLKEKPLKRLESLILVGTDILLTLISSGDKHHDKAVKIMDKFEGEIILSPYSLIELDLIIKSRRIVISNIKAFYSLFKSLLEYRDINLLSPKPTYHAEAYGLREKYKQLTYFDSLHAGVGVAEGLELISYDGTYADITELRYNHPSRFV